MDKRYRALAFTVLLFGLAVCWKNDFIRFLLGFEVLTLVLLLAEVRFLRKQLQISLTLPEKVVYKSESFPVEAVAANRSLLPVTKIRVQVLLFDRWSSRELRASGILMLDGKETGRLRMTFSPGYCGVYEVRISSYRVWDHLGIFSALKRTDLHARTLYVLPAEVSDKEEESLAGQDQADENPALFRQGQSAVDVSDIREYRVGDNVKHIHWKLSVKAGDILVRQMGEPVEKMNQIYLNLQYRDKKLSRETWEAFLASTAGYCGKLLQRGHSHNVFWVDIEIRKIVEYRVTDPGGLNEMLCGLLHARPWREGEVREVLEEIRWNETMEEIIEIGIEGNIGPSGITR